MSAEIDIPALLRTQRIVVCCGAGGVGKTTSAAALGVLAAREGRSVLVMTIDPAQRLAQAMGLAALGSEPQDVTVPGPGKLAAMMLDSKRTFDHMVETYAPDAQVKETIFANTYYQQLSDTMAGSRELVAMEQVLEIVNSDAYDLLIVDTPPAQHALDFLDAPKRLIDLLDGSFTQMLITPYGAAARAQFNFFRQSSAAALKFMERLTGIEMLADLSEFLLAFSSMFDGVKERSARVLALMSDSSTSFLLICAPEPVSLSQVETFCDRLTRDRIQIGGVLVNRVHPLIEDVSLTEEDLVALRRISVARVDGKLFADRVYDTLTEARALGEGDARAMAVLDQLELPIRRVPHFNRDLHDMSDLEIFAGQLD